MSTERFTRDLVVVPTYNESSNITELITRLRQEVPDAGLLVVDDNSPDGTGRMVEERATKEPGIFLLKREGKEGLGKAYLAGFRWALDHGFDRIVQIDADFSHNPADVKRLLTTLETYDVAIGCRYMKGGATPGWSVKRRWISQSGNVYARMILGIKYRDLTGGFNAWRAEVLRTINLNDVQSKGYAFQVELKYRAHVNGFKISEIPIIFSERVNGVSKMSANIVKEAVLRIPELRKISPSR